MGDLCLVLKHKYSQKQDGFYREIKINRGVKNEDFV